MFSAAVNSTFHTSASTSMMVIRKTGSLFLWWEALFQLSLLQSWCSTCPDPSFITIWATWQSSSSQKNVSSPCRRSRCPSTTVAAGRRVLPINERCVKTTWRELLYRRSKPFSGKMHQVLALKAILRVNMIAVWARTIYQCLPTSTIPKPPKQSGCYWLPSLAKDRPWEVQRSSRLTTLI